MFGAKTDSLVDLALTISAVVSVRIAPNATTSLSRPAQRNYCISYGATSRRETTSVRSTVMVLFDHFHSIRVTPYYRVKHYDTVSRSGRQPQTSVEFRRYKPNASTSGSWSHRNPIVAGQVSGMRSIRSRRVVSLNNQNALGWVDRIRRLSRCRTCKTCIF